VAKSSDLVRDRVSADESAYESDVYAWALHQARLIREGRLGDADLANIAEELVALGRSELKELRSALARIIHHLLKWDFQADKRSPSWRHSIQVHRVHARQTLEENHSLRPKLEEIIAGAYELGVAYAVEDTGLPPRSFPSSCPYTFDAIMTRDVGAERE
jgi:hypothetical protein